MAKLVWKYGDKPTGPYRSFSFRAWPIATIGRDGPMIAALHPVVEDRTRARNSYSPAVAETTTLVVKIADHRGEGSWKWVQLKGRPVGVTEAKALVDQFLKVNPDYREAADASRA